jgi:hypothetical protein
MEPFRVLPARLAFLFIRLAIKCLRPPNDGNGRAIRMKSLWISSRCEAKELQSRARDQSNIPRRTQILYANLALLIGFVPDSKIHRDAKEKYAKVNQQFRADKQTSEAIRHRLRVRSGDSLRGGRRWVIELEQSKFSAPFARARRVK